MSEYGLYPFLVEQQGCLFPPFSLALDLRSDFLKRRAQSANQISELTTYTSLPNNSCAWLAMAEDQTDNLTLQGEHSTN